MASLSCVRNSVEYSERVVHQFILEDFLLAETYGELEPVLRPQKVLLCSTKMFGVGWRIFLVCFSQREYEEPDPVHPPRRMLLSSDAVEIITTGRRSLNHEVLAMIAVLNVTRSTGGLKNSWCSPGLRFQWQQFRLQQSPLATATSGSIVMKIQMADIEHKRIGVLDRAAAQVTAPKLRFVASESEPPSVHCPCRPAWVDVISTT